MCDCEICRWNRSLKYKKKDELIEIIKNQSFDLQFTKLYEHTLYDAIKYITPDIWEKSKSFLEAIGEFEKYIYKLKMTEELKK